MDLSTNQLNDFLWLDVNQDQTCFVTGSERGYKIFQIDPLQFTHARHFDGAGGIGIVAMLFRSNLLALVGGGRNPRYPPTKVILWDDREGKAIAELSFRIQVRSVKLRRDIITVAVDSKVYVYRFSDLELLDSLDTTGVLEMDACMLSVCGQDNITAIACPGNVTGRVNVGFYDPTGVAASGARMKITSIMAHESQLAVMSLNFDGTKIATASIKGTLIRVYDTQSGDRLIELRRGAERVDIYSIAFSSQSDWLAVSSDKGTIHVFSLRNASGSFTVNQKSSLFTISKILPSYFQSQWSFAQFRVPDYRTICAFGKDPYTVICLCADGSYYKVKFDPILGGEMKRLKFDKFID